MITLFRTISDKEEEEEEEEETANCIRAGSAMEGQKEVREGELTNTAIGDR